MPTPSRRGPQPWLPSLRHSPRPRRAKTAGAPVEVDISNLKPGEEKRRMARQGGVGDEAHRRTTRGAGKNPHLAIAGPKIGKTNQPAYVNGAPRAPSPDLVVMEGVCTISAARPTEKATPGELATTGRAASTPAGSKFDFAGRVFTGSPAPRNLDIPPHKIDGTKLVIGIGKTVRRRNHGWHSSNHPRCSEPVLNWVNDRFRMTALIKTSASEYCAPKNFNFWYYFGSLALLVHWCCRSSPVSS